MASSGIAELDRFTGGLPRGCLTEIYGPASSGRTSLLLAALTSATRRGEFCALVDAGDAFDPQSAADAGVLFQRLLWIRCGESSSKPNRESSRSRTARKNSRLHNLDQALRTLDLLLSSGGFGLIAFDLAGVSPHLTRKIPLTTWFRFRRAVETTPTILLAIEDQPLAGSCSSLLLHLSADGIEPLQPQLPVPTHAQLLPGIHVRMQSERSRLERKSASPASFFRTGSFQTSFFQTKTSWAG
jgi:recombination protein RecA